MLFENLESDSRLFKTGKILDSRLIYTGEHEEAKILEVA